MMAHASSALDRSRPRANAVDMLRLGLAVSLASLVLACAAPQRTAMPWSSASSDPEIVNLTPVTFASDSGATQAVQTECDLQHRLPEWIAQYTPVPVVLAQAPSGAVRVLALTITGTLAPGGGTWSGPKQLKVHGDLIQNAMVIASFDVQRTTMVGGWASGGGTCEVLDYISEAIAKDIRPWLSRPTPGALLGELR